MFLPRTIHVRCLALACAVMTAGCDPGRNSPLDEQKDPHFLRGRNYSLAMDYENAMKSFDEALKANPNSASAHKELGLLYYQNRKDHARAIYHFQRLLDLRPEDEHAEIFRGHILDCKRELAREVALLPANQTVQKNLEQLELLKKENQVLKQQLEMLRAQLNQALSAQRLTPNPTMLPGQTNAASSNIQPRSTQLAPDHSLPSLPMATNSPPAITQRTHTVKSGDTPGSIAKQHRVPLNKLLEANPRLDARRMQIGQVVNIPAP